MSPRWACLTSPDRGGKLRWAMGAHRPDENAVWQVEKDAGNADAQPTKHTPLRS